ncbi:MAG: PDZ domain-containing protein, partial [Planctomycetota bacterium]|nr:PDZ domain-containing protein [Planctomycetota bacterium]
LLGVVTAPVPDKNKQTKVVVLHVLKKSPAAKAGLDAGDEILSIAGKRVFKPQDVDAALKEYGGGEKVAIEYRRDKKKTATQAKLIERIDYRGDFLKRRRRGATKFKAPEWFVYAWAQAGKEPPTLTTTKKKVVVIHCFQSW